MLETTSADLLPAASVIARMTIQALDSLPLPVLVVAFLLLLVLLQWPLSQKSSLLPTHTPDMTLDKSRLSPLPFPFPHNTSSSQSSPPRQASPTFYPVFDQITGRPKYVLIDPATACKSASASGSGNGASSGARSPPRISPGIGRRGSKNYWRGSLGGIEEEDEKRFSEA